MSKTIEIPINVIQVTIPVKISIEAQIDTTPGDDVDEKMLDLIRELSELAEKYGVSYLDKFIVEWQTKKKTVAKGEYTIDW